MLNDAPSDRRYDSDDLPAAELSPREVEILVLIARGLTNSEIVDVLYLSMNTVKSHIRSAYRKIGVSSRSQAVIWCFHSGLVQVERRRSASES